MAIEVDTRQRYRSEQSSHLASRQVQSEDVDWLGLLRTLWRRKFFLIGLVGIVTGLTILYVSSVTPIFEAESLVMLSDRDSQVVDIAEVLPGVVPNEQGVEGQTMLIMTRDMAAGLVDRLNLHLLPEFNPSIALAEDRPLMLRILRALPGSWQAALAIDATAPLGDPDNGMLSDLALAEAVRQVIVEGVFASMVAEPVGRSAVISVRFMSSDPKITKLGANALAELYIDELAAEKSSAGSRATTFLDQEIDRLRQELAEEEGAIQDYRRSTGLFESSGPTLDAQQLSQLTSQLVVARSERAAASARLAQVNRLLASDTDFSTAAQMLNSPTIRELEVRDIEIRRRLAELGTEYRERHPVMVNLRADANELQERMRAEISKIVLGLRNEVQVAHVREAAFEANLDELKARVSTSNQEEIVLHEMERQAVANRSLLETYLSRSAEIVSQQKVDEPEARIISRAILPDKPVFPKRTTIVILALFGSMLIGSVVVFGLEQMDQTIRSSEQIENLLGLPSLGLIPHIRGLGRDAPTPEAYVIAKPHSPFGEAVRSLRTSLLLTGSETPPRSLLLTSSLPGEGKTSLALSLARVNARSGRKTIILDCDTRRPRLHQATGSDNKIGLSTVLSGECDVDEATRIDEPSGARFVTAGPPIADPTVALASDTMRGLLARLSRRYDLVLVDSPPVLSVADARVLSQLVDGTIFVVRWGHTRRREAMSGVKHLIETGGRVEGVVLSRVDVRKHAGYGYIDSGYYHDERYTKYYD